MLLHALSAAEEKLENLDIAEFADATTAQSVRRIVRKRLTENRLYGHHFRDIKWRNDDGVLTLLGRVPTFHLKQILQSLLRGIDGVEQIDNQVLVISATGLSSEARRAI